MRFTAHCYLITEASNLLEPQEREIDTQRERASERARESMSERESKRKLESAVDLNSDLQMAENTSGCLF